MMRYAATLVLVLALAALGAGQDATPDTQAGNFLFSVPTGWNSQEKGDTTFIFAPAQPAGATTFIALAGNDMEGDLRNSFNQLWAGFTNSYRVLQGGQIAPLHSKKGYDAFYTAALASDKNGMRWQVFVMGTHIRIGFKP